MGTIRLQVLLRGLPHWPSSRRLPGIICLPVSGYLLRSCWAHSPLLDVRSWEKKAIALQEVVVPW